MKRKIAISSVVTLLAMTALSLNVSEAAPTTTGAGEFGQSDDIPEVTKPGAELPIDPEDKSEVETVDGVHLLYVPNFNFGKNNLKVRDTEFPVTNIAYNKIGETKKYEIPQFLQVADYSGKEGTRWEVKATQETNFKSANHELKNTRIRLYGTKALTSLGTVESMVDSLTIASGYQVLPTKADSGVGLSMLKSKGGIGAASTNGTIASLVFDDSYDEGSYGVTEAPADVNKRGKNNKVKLFVPKNDQAQVDKYKATITWTLSINP